MVFLVGFLDISQGIFYALWYIFSGILHLSNTLPGGRLGHDHMVVGFKTNCAISDYHH